MFNSPFSSLFGNTQKTLSFKSILDGTEKTLGIINQTIPIIYQIKPLLDNAKTIFKIADEIKKPNNINKENINIENKELKNIKENPNKPTFYI